MITHQGGEIIVANLPFIGGGGTKRRPLLVLLDIGDADLIVAPITGQSAQARFEVALSEWQQAGLRRPSVVRVHKLTTIEKQSITHSLGVLTPRDWAQVRSRVKRLWAKI